MQTVAGFQLPSIEDIAKWVASWLEPLSKTGLGFIKWEAQSRSTGAYIAILLVLALSVVRVLMGRRRKVTVFVATLVSVIVLLLVNVAFSMLNNHLMEQQQILFWRDSIWMWAYCFLCASIPCFVVATTYLVRLPGGPPAEGAGG